MIIRRIPLWKATLFTIILLYLVFCYGFANFSILSVPVGYLLLAISVFFCYVNHNLLINKYLREPIFVSVIIIILFSFGHLLVDFPRYGLYAIRDATFSFELIVLILGFVWGKKSFTHKEITRFLLIAFIANFLYSLTFPFSSFIKNISPVSGVFQPIPVFGYYSHTFYFLLLGSVFCFLQLDKFTHKSLIKIFGAVQLLWAFAFQSRTTYISIIVILFLLIFFKRNISFSKLVLVLVIGVFLLILLQYGTSLVIPGRLGNMNIDFYISHIKSIFLVEDSEELGSAMHRIKLVEESLRIWRSSLESTVFGTGFGEPIIDLYTTGIQIRNPHNTHLTYLVRLGIVGAVLWVFLNIRMLIILFQNIQLSDLSEKGFEVWVFLYFITGLLLTAFQPWLEFPYGTIPFFSILGYSIGTFYNKKNALKENR